MRGWLLYGLCAYSLLTITACGGNGGSPTAPTNTLASTKILALGGNLSFGAVALNTKATGLLTITNSGTASLTVSSISGPCASSFSLSFTSGAVAPGQTVNATITFTPTTVTNCSGTITVNADQTSGTNTISVNASGTLNGVPVFSQTGVGNAVFTLPSYVSKIRITGVYLGVTSNFVVKVNGALIVNDLVGTNWGLTVDDGTYLVPTGGQVAITLSSGVAWTITEAR